jgi:hypothetical protein
MSDYLGKLVSRSLSPLTVVRPRLLSLFEPPRTNRELIRMPDIEPAPSDAEQVKERSPSAVLVPQLPSVWSSEPNLQDPGLSLQAPREKIQPEAVKRVEQRDLVPIASALSQAPAAGPAPDKEPPALGAQTRTTLFPSIIETVSPKPVPHGAEAVSPLSSQSSVLPFPEVIGKSRAGTVHPELSRGENGSAQRSRAHEWETKNSLESGFPRRPKTSEATPPSRADTGDGLKAENRSEQQIQPQPVPVTGIVFERRTKSLPVVPIVPASIIASPSILPPSPQREHPVERPSIHVSIGRVEVRVAPPPARPRPQAAQTRVMSLDEYLRQRTSGGSR